MTMMNYRFVFAFALATGSIFLAGCGAAPADSTQDESTTDALISRSSWLKRAELGWVESFKGLPATIEVSRASLPAGAKRGFDKWSTPQSNPVHAYSWTYRGRTGFFLDQLYNGSDSEITALYDANGRLLSTCDSPNGETLWVHPDGTSDDPNPNP
jgi:hypothetical protein